MFTWTSKAGLALAAALTLAGCDAAPMVGAGAGGFAFTRAAPEKIAVANDSVIVAGPEGYCIDNRATRDQAAGAFVLLASCAAITRRGTAPHPVFPALLTVSITPDAAGAVPVAKQAPRLKRFFSSAEGRAALSRDGQASSIDVVETFTRDGAFIIHARDHGNDGTPGLSEDHWRAIFNVNGQIVSASVMALEDHPITDDAGMATLWDLATRISRESIRPVAGN